MMDPTKLPAPPSRLLVVGVLVAHLLAGVAAGIALDRLVLLDWGRRPAGEWGMGRRGPWHMGREGAGHMQGRMLARIGQELDLTAEQREQVEAILPRHLAAFDSLRREMGPRLSALLDSTSAEVEAILTPDQRERWRRIRRQAPGSPEETKER